MSLITRTAKGSKLTIAEMDGNLEYLQANGFVDGTYSQLTEGTGAILSMDNTFGSVGEVGTYEGIEPQGGSGTGLIVDVEITSPGSRGGLIATYTIVEGGSGYQVNDELTINADLLGGTMALGNNNTNTITLNPANLDGNKITKISIGSFSGETAAQPETEPFGGEELVYGLINSSTNFIELVVNASEEISYDASLPQTLSPSVYLQSDSTYSQIDISTGNQGINNIQLYEDDNNSYISMSSQNEFGSSNIEIGGNGIILSSNSLAIKGLGIQILNEAILVIGLPSEDPLIADQLWNDNGTLKISAGE
jgi:hypothetical protein